MKAFPPSTTLAVVALFPLPFPLGDITDGLALGVLPPSQSNPVLQKLPSHVPRFPSHPQ